MKFFLFLVALANVGLFMWEYKQGFFEPTVENAEQYDSPDQERILLVSELKEAQQAQAPVPKPDVVAVLEQTPQVPEGLKTQDDNPKPEQINPSKDDLTIASAQLDESSTEESVEQKKETALPETARLDDAKLEQPKPESKEEGLASVSEKLAESTAERPAERKKAETAPPESGHLDKAKSARPAPESKPVQPIIATAEKAKSHNTTNDLVNCYEVGPFANGSAYQLWKRELNAPKDAIKSFSRDSEVISDYLVYYPAAETKQQTDANLKMLKDKGLSDLWPLTKGKDKGQISLGIFKNESRAQTLKSQLLAKDIQAEVKPRLTMKPQKYVQVKADGKVLERLNVMKQTYPAIAVKQINQCW